MAATEAARSKKTLEYFMAKELSNLRPRKAAVMVLKMLIRIHFAYSPAYSNKVIYTTVVLRRYFALISSGLTSEN
jgi:hypothetical protein